jgi:hypothetical protein
VVKQDPIGTPLPYRPILSLDHGYHSLNTSIPIPVPSKTSEIFIPPGSNASGFILTPSQVLSGGSYVHFIGGCGSSGTNTIGGTTQSFNSGYHIILGGQYNPGGQPQFGGQTQIGAQFSLGGQPSVGGYNPPYGKNILGSLDQYWKLLIQGNPQSSEGKHPRVSSFIPPSFGQPYLGSLNPTWGLNVHYSIPFQGNIPNQHNPMGYMPPNPRLNLPGPSPYMQTTYGPTGIPTGFPPQSHQYPHMNRQLPFLATLDLPNLSRILNDHVLHSPHWPVIPTKLPYDIPKF